MTQETQPARKVQPYIEIENLTMRYGTKQVLDVEELAIYRGEVLAIIGPNGSGKSTLLRSIGLLEKPSSGSVKFLQVGDGASGLDKRRYLATVFQEALLFKGTVFDNIAYGLKVRKVPKREIEGRVREAAEMLHISHLLERPANRISGGEAQRTSLARAIILKPELLLLDEPMANLDPPTKEALLADLDQILHEFNMAVVYVTHELREALILADRWAVMDEGRIIQVGTPREVMDNPLNPKIADFVGVENMLKATVVGADKGVIRAKLNGKEVEAIDPDGVAARAGKIWVLIRPENVTITAEEPKQRTSARNLFAGTVETILDLGMIYRIVIDCAGVPLVSVVTRQSVEEMGLHVGQRVWATFKATGVHVISRDSARGH